MCFFKIANLGRPKTSKRELLKRIENNEKEIVLVNIHLSDVSSDFLHSVMEKNGYELKRRWKSCGDSCALIVKTK